MEQQQASSNTGWNRNRGGRTNDAHMHTRPHTFKRPGQPGNSFVKQGRNAEPLPLEELRRKNAAKTRRYYGGNGRLLDTPGSVPRTAPRAPENTNSFLMGSRDTPEITAWERGPNWTSGYQTLDEDAAALGAQLDFFGTNEGLITKRDSPAFSSDNESESDGNESEPEDLHGFQLQIDDDEADRTIPRHIKARLEEQTSYIATLEEENLNLRERIFLLQQQLNENNGVEDEPQVDHSRVDAVEEEYTS